MITATDLKNGTTFEMDGKPYKVVRYSHTKIGRGGATVRLSLRNLRTGQAEEKTLNSTVRVDEIVTTKRPMQYLYADEKVATFMNPSSYEQVEVDRDLVEEELPYVKEGETVNLLFWNENVLSIDIPPKVSLEVIDTNPGVKGNSATNIYKPAKLENGLETKVPLFIKVGDKVRIDTRTGEYVERVAS